MMDTGSWATLGTGLLTAGAGFWAVVWSTKRQSHENIIKEFSETLLALQELANSYNIFSKNNVELAKFQKLLKSLFVLQKMQTVCDKNFFDPFYKQGLELIELLSPLSDLQVKISKITGSYQSGTSHPGRPSVEVQKATDDKYISDTHAICEEYKASLKEFNSKIDVVINNVLK